MSIFAYRKDFPVCKEFDLMKYMQILDEENFQPFLLFLERISDSMFYGQFKNIKSLLPPFAGAERGNAADQMFLTECKFEWLQSSGIIRITASIGPIVSLVINSLIIGAVALVCGASIGGRVLAVVFLLALFLLWNYYWDARRYNYIGQIANESKRFAK